VPAVRKATPADFPALTAALARAFDDDPVMHWLFPGEDRRRRNALRIFDIRLRQLIGQEQVYTTEDLAGAAIWSLPDRWQVGLRDSLELARLLLTPRLPVLFSGFQRLENAHPHKPPHFYLAVLGTDPAEQGRGVGSALLRPVLELCDREGLPAYLESSKESNVDFYARHGFRVTCEIRLPKGPPMWPMWRGV
jgi:ribosomal protein S18 acetylase RimI-like enzyme